MKGISTICAILALALAGCGQKDAAQKAQKPDKAPAEAGKGETPSLPAPPPAESLVTVEIMIQEGGGYEKPLVAFPGEKRIGWKDFAASLEEACRKAPREYLRLGGEPSPKPAAGKAAPGRLLLRWNPTIRKMKVYLDNQLMNYNERGVEKARAILEERGDLSDLGLEFDVGGDVNSSHLIPCLLMARDLKARHTLVFGGAGNEEDPVDAESLGRYWGADEGFFYCPFVELRIRCDYTQFKRVRSCLRLCARLGVRRIYLANYDGGGAHAEVMAEIFLPLAADLPPKAPGTEAPGQNVAAGEEKNAALEDAEITDHNETDDEPEEEPPWKADPGKPICLGAR